MKNKKLLSSAAVAALCLPLAAFGQSSSGTSGTTGTDATANPYSTQSQRPTSQQSGAQTGARDMQGQQTRDHQSSARSQQQRDTTTSSSSMTQRQGQTNQAGLQGSSSIANIKKVKESSIENKMTAERLLGKTVVDRDGEKIGEVKDIGLSGALSASADRSHSALNQNQSSSMRQSGIGSETAATGQRDPARASSPVAGTQSSTSTSRSSSMMDREVHVYISTDNDMLLQVPLSELTFNDRDDELRLNVAESQLDSIRESTVAAFD